jgi:hypothetical protein
MPTRHVVDGLGNLRHLKGWKPSLPHAAFRALHGGYVITSSNLLPESADTRTIAPYKVKDQGALGTCVCHSTTSALEYLLKRNGEDASLSRLWLYEQTRQREGTPLTEDSGCAVIDAVSVLSGGCPDESIWPYDMETWMLVAPPEVDELAKHRALFYYQCPTHATIKASIAQGFPVAMGMSLPNSALSPQTAQDGLIKFPGPTDDFAGGHSMLIVAYDDRQMVGADMGAYMVLNSWGDNWGKGGFAWVPYRFMLTGLMSDCWTLRHAEP